MSKEILFENWINENGISESVELFLKEKGYDTLDLLPYISNKMIQESNLSVNDKKIIKDVLNLNENLEMPNEENLVERKKSRWKEFGLAKKFQKWNKDFYPVELFSPDGYWAWNSSAKSLLYGKENTSATWMGFDENKPGWMMSPPVLLPVELGAFKLSFNLRINPEECLLILQILLVNDGYNKNIAKFYNFPLKFQIKLYFINLSNGMKVGDPIIYNCTFNELHDSENFDVPGNVLSLKKPPIISVHVEDVE